MKKSAINVDMPEAFSRDKWAKIGTRRRSGICVPLFSVYSRKSLGIGDLEDLKLLIDLAEKTGNSIIQLLPMNEAGGITCPYDSISSFALEPVYISLRKLAQPGGLKDEIGEAEKLFPAGRAYVDYGIKPEKLKLLEEMFFAQKNYESPEFQHFRQENNYWLQDFALYKALKDYHSGKAWYEWEDKYRDRDRDALEKFLNTHETKIMFHMWVQWVVFKQFREAKAYAALKGILLKGDLPILVSRDSADVWTHPEFFKLEFASGAPPDMYCAKGQRWGMPTYNWERIAFDDYRYLKERLKFAQNFYDILRVDHVVGLFRIWSIPYNDPLENQGLNGFFDPREENKWGGQGRKILSLILDNTKMLLCAEDLGTIPKVCTQTLEELSIPGNDVQRWVKDWVMKHDFLAPEGYRFLSVSMLSTHDTTNWLAWWENEAGTIDEALFIRKCADRKIDYDAVHDRLFDANLSKAGRLRWQESVASVDKLVKILGREKKEVADYIEMYENTYHEKEKLWKQLELNGPMREKADHEVLAAVLKITLASKAVFSIQLITDWLGLTDLLKGDPYFYRINTPGTISPQNWSLVMPIPLEDLLKHKVCGQIKELVTASGR